LSLRAAFGWWCLLVAVLAGCAAVPRSFPVGTPMAEVESVMGRPRVVLTAPDGDTVWQFPTGAGQRTFIARFGADQRLKSFEQVLTQATFAKIRPGMTRAEIQLLLGPPNGTRTFRWRNEEVWSYAYQAALSDNRIFNVHFDAKTGEVRRTSDQADELLSPTNIPAL
jgi:hypothetical protein